MMNRTLPKKLRRQNKIVETINGNWVQTYTTSSNITHDSGLYFDASSTTITFPIGTENEFKIGDIIHISSHRHGESKRKKKIHVARRRKQKKQITHVITDISTTTMTIEVNSLVTVTKISEDCWSVYGNIT